MAPTSVAQPSEATGRLVFLPPDWLPIALVAGDALIVAGSALAGYWLYRNHRVPVLPFGPYEKAIPVAVVAFLGSLWINRQYSSWRGLSLVDQVLALYRGIGLAALLLLAAITLGNLGTEYSRLSFAYAVGISVVAMTGERYLLRQYETRLRRRGIGTEKVLMVGTGTGSELLIQRMTMFPQYGYQPCGVISDESPPGAEFAGVTVLGRIDDLPEIARLSHADQVFLALPTHQRERLLHLITLCEDQHLDFMIVPDLLELMTTQVAANAIDGLPLLGFRQSRLTGSATVVKRLVDIVISAFALVVVSPILLVLAILIKVTMPGPVLFRQERIGRYGRPFIIYKFRTMIVDAEKVSGPVVAKPGDSRVTGLGRVMRKLSLDELPQFINILIGNMSVVGPRPQPTFFDVQYSGEVPRYLERQQVRPGLTGWAEVNDLRGAAPILDRTRYDVYYIENWSLALDLKIVLLTALRMFYQRHAY